MREQLEELPRSQREDVVRAVRDSGYPARETLEDFRVLVAEPILSAPSRPRAVRNTPRPAFPPGETPRPLTTRKSAEGCPAAPRDGLRGRCLPPGRGELSRVGIIVWCPYHRMFQAPRISRSA